MTFWGYKKAVEYLGRKAAMPPTGLATVLAMLPKKNFEPQRIIDLNVEPLKDEQIKNADIIFTSTMIVQEDSHNEVIDRAHFHGKRVVAGGPFPTSYPERNAGADYIVAGEAEMTLNPFLEDLLKSAPGKTYTEDNVKERTSTLLTKTGKVNITKTPLPRWDLVSLIKYFSAAIQYSRGCPFDCDFCDITKLFGRESRTKTPQQMILELDYLYSKGHVGPVFIVDDNFIGNRKNVKELLPHLANWQKRKNYPFSFFTEASMNLAWDSNNDILKGMVEAGFDQVFLGIESIDNDVLKAMSKSQNTKMSQLEAVRRIQQAGLEVTGGFIIGSDGEKPDACNNLFNFIQEAGIVVAMPGLLTALKGTDLYQRLEKEERIKEESKGNNTHHLNFNFKTQQDEASLIKNYKELIEKLFSAGNYYARCRTLQENIGRKNRLNRATLEGGIAFGKSLNRQLLARGGIEYAKYLIKTAIKNPGYFPEAVAQAVKFDHFNTITRATLEADSYIPHAESLYHQFVHKAEEIYAKHSHDVDKSKKLIVKTAQKIVKKAERKYDKIHEEFKSHAESALNNLKQRIHETVEIYRTDNRLSLSQ